MSKRTSGDPQQGWIGFDLGDKKSSICIVDGEGAIVRRETVKTTRRSLTGFFGKRAACVVVMEAGTQSGWVSRLLTELGHDVVVGNPRRIALISKSIRKTDRNDAETLARLGRFDRELLSPIKHRSERAQADLALLRQRDQFVRLRTALINHVRSQAKVVSGVRLRACSTPAFVKTALEELPAELAEILAPMLETIDHLSTQIKRCEASLRRVAKRYPVAARLREIAGVGPLTSLCFVLTIEDPHRFPRRRDVGAYLGLVPKQRASGERDRQLRITKAGNPQLRRYLVAAAHYILGHCGPDTDLKRWGLKLCERGGSNAKKRAAVAVARKLAVILLSLWQTEQPYEPLRDAA